MSLPLGELAAIGTACCWTVSSIAFSAAGRRIGSLTLNLVRLVIAFLLLMAYCTVCRGTPLPLDASTHTWYWMLASGFVGYVLGDLCLFRAFVLIGPRLSMLLMALAPPIAAVLGFFMLNETIPPLGIVGMIVTIGGVSWVVRERPDPAASTTTISGSALRQGILLGFGGAIGQALGMVFSKKGIGSYDPIAAGQIRVLAGVVGFSILFTAIGWWGKTKEGLRDKTALGYASVGALLGPVMGVSLSLIAVQLTATGIAATLMSTTPVLLIPVVVLSGQEKVSARAGVGAIVAVVGVALLCFR